MKKVLHEKVHHGKSATWKKCYMKKVQHEKKYSMKKVLYEKSAT